MTDFYETDEQLGQYMDFHFGPERFGVANYPRVCAERCLSVAKGRGSALDLGCATGRSTLELARGFESVVGVDLSHRFIQAAEALRRDGEMAYQLVDEGELRHAETASLAELGLEEAAGRVSFEEGDAGDLAGHHQGYDLIFAGNLIDRMPDPGAFLRGLHELLGDQGVVVISSPYTLLEDFTPRENWIGGYYANGQPVTVLDGMKQRLSEHFRLAANPEDIPFVIRETRRKHQHTLAQLTVWERKD
ncbi:putative 4-mercaptohistidine N1-methyltransferase [Halospina denitrificans]|uniref:Putative 4-mercaptohistidine N1-methyltransferase n=1 Tax=Halospina denitrificans TaxID=332522 RepID=A0A4R7K296_9GAMM|nr:putative 4-mercaptohistidine N1-methyltransferase [Halospina denitrificans]TDT44514.1 putative 4-mercaptohistidine N1-methyltransferase [Halospina denitrificans]